MGVVSPRLNAVLLFSVFCVAVCGLIYELLAGTVSSYLMGDSVYQFSIVIGVFVSSMGFGSYLTRFLDKKLPDRFVLIELIIGVLGGYSAAILFYAFAVVENYTPVLFLVTFSLGALIGLEIPVVIRILKDISSLKINVSNVFTVDYIGALFASILFPIILVPKLGLMRTAFLFGLINIGVGCLGLYAFKDIIKERKQLFLVAIFSIILIALGLVNSSRVSSYLEDRLYQDEIIFSHQTPYQKIVVTRANDQIRMFIDGSIQFNSRDEYRYHESLVHPAMATANKRDNILIIGGGDGMAVREVLKYKDVKSVTLVDIDKVITDLFKTNKLLSQLNDGALSDKKVKIVNQDGWKFLETSKDWFDVVIVDLPDPDNFSLSKLYSRSFYKLLCKHLTASGIIVTQATSPLYSREAFWCIFHTLSSIDSPMDVNEKLFTQAYHVYVPSFGEWGFVMASISPIQWDHMEFTVPTKFFSQSTADEMIQFPNDIKLVETDINTIDTHKVIAYYEKGWESCHL
jgi:spermidine synthase